MVCYKVPNLKVIEGEYAVFALGIERLKIHALSAIFFAKMRDSLNEMKANPIRAFLKSKKNGGMKPSGFASWHAVPLHASQDALHILRHRRKMLHKKRLTMKQLHFILL